MTGPAKFLSPVLLDRDGWWRAIDTEGEAWHLPRKCTEALVDRGQQLKGGAWPEGFGVVELEDIPELLPTTWYFRDDNGKLQPSRYDQGHLNVAIVAFDADGTTHVARVRP